jgi:uncharacterized membrane protein YeaQ/YmgE (transglycosylase-associated protein family)
MAEGLSLVHVLLSQVPDERSWLSGHVATLRARMLGTVLSVLVAAFVTGALARLAVPGPDPMPAWLTILIGLAGSAGGGALAIAIWGRDPYAVSICSFLVAVLLVVGYRRFVQRRAIVGRDALRFPERGVGVPQYRDRLRRVGIDPDRTPFDAVAQPMPGVGDGAELADPEEEDALSEDVLSPEQRTDALRRLAAQLAAGEISEREYREQRHRLVYGEG